MNPTIYPICPAIKPLPKEVPCDFTGLKVGKLTVLSYSADVKKRWVVECACGNFQLKQSKILKVAGENACCYQCERMPKSKPYAVIFEPPAPIRNKPAARTQCGKMGFKSSSAAKKAMRSRLNKACNVSRLRCYHCPTCHLWHLSSVFFDK